MTSQTQPQMNVKMATQRSRSAVPDHSRHKAAKTEKRRRQRVSKDRRYCR
ncbi:MAG: hypothetical protein LBH00_01090 [Planctomycetaceae bacterium]|nr:hypothetical protein [Planctomycetaceae bacterium]